MTHLTRYRRSEDGAVAVEVALLAPLLFSMIFGIICMGYAMALSHSVTQLATSAARASVPGITATERSDLAQAYLEAAPCHYPLLSAPRLNSTIDVAPNAALSDITVTVSYDLDASILTLRNGFLGLDVGPLSGRAYLVY